MKESSLSDFIRGWIIGDFDPTLFKTTDFEVGIKEYKKGDSEEEHYHLVSREITVIASGRAKMKNNIYEKGAIIDIAPGISTDFEAMEDTITVVIKVPSAKDDKYLGSQ